MKSRVQFHQQAYCNNEVKRLNVNVRTEVGAAQSSILKPDSVHKKSLAQDFCFGKRVIMSKSKKATT